MEIRAIGPAVARPGGVFTVDVELLGTHNAIVATVNVATAQEAAAIAGLRAGRPVRGAQGELTGLGNVPG